MRQASMSNSLKIDATRRGAPENRMKTIAYFSHIRYTGYRRNNNVPVMRGGTLLLAGVVPVAVLLLSIDVILLRGEK